MKGDRMRSVNKRVAAGLRRSRVALYSVLTPLLAFTLAGAADSFKRILFIVLGFSLVIFLHELGHFLVARACSVKCLAFSIGIGPRMLGWRRGRGLTFGKDPYEGQTGDSAGHADRVVIQTESGPKEIHPDTKNLTADILGKPTTEKKLEHMEAATTHSDLPTSATAPPHPKDVGDCDYRISWLPLGGYVRMLGQDDMDPTKVSSDPRAFNMRPVWQRMCIVSAGVIMNVIFAAVTFSIIFSHGIGVNFPPARIGLVAYNSPAYKAGIQMGDEITAINGKRDRGFVEFTDVQIACALSTGTEPIDFQWKRPQGDGSDVTMHKGITPVRPGDGGFLMIGVSPMPGLNIANSEDVLKDAVETRRKPLSEDGYGQPEEANELAKLHMHDHIVALDGQPVSDYVAFYNLLQKAAGKPLAIKVHNDDSTIADRTVTIKARLELRPGADGYPAVAGLLPRVKALEPTKGQGAAAAGMKDGDVIVRVGERSNPTIKQMMEIVGKNAGNPALPIDVMRNGEKIQLTAKVSKAGKIGVPLHDDVETTFVSVSDRAQAPDVPLLNQSTNVRIVSIDGQPVASWTDIYGILKTHAAGDKVPLGFASGAASTQPGDAAASAPATATTTITVSEELAGALREQTHYIANIPVENETRTQRADTTWGAVVMGAQHTEKFILQVYMTLRGLFIGTVSPTNLHGIVGITKVGYDIQERGHVWLWYVLAMVSVNLAVANFLPLPIVDGGLFLLLILEKIRGKPLSLKVQSAIQIVGIVLLAGLFLFVTYNDIGMFMGGK
jgi:regulator of sigma E protease